MTTHFTRLAFFHFINCHCHWLTLSLLSFDWSIFFGCSTLLVLTSRWLWPCFAFGVTFGLAPALRFDFRSQVGFALFLVWLGFCLLFSFSLGLDWFAWLGLGLGFLGVCSIMTCHPCWHNKPSLRLRFTKPLSYNLFVVALLYIKRVLFQWQLIFNKMTPRKEQVLLSYHRKLTTVMVLWVVLGACRGFDDNKITYNSLQKLSWTLNTCSNLILYCCRCDNLLQGR